MTITTNNPLDVAFLEETHMSVPPGHHALRRFLRSDAFKQALTEALVEIEESKLSPACLSDSCDHDECPEPLSISCGDAAEIIEYVATWHTAAAK